MKLNNLQEELVRLFLRLNGYFTTGLIIHSNILGKNSTELDVIGVRFPNHNQNDREIGCCEYLKIPSNTIDIIIGEVKGGSERNQFNLALRDNRDVIEKLIGWIGAFSIEEQSKVVDELKLLIKPKPTNSSEEFVSLKVDGKFGNFTLRPIIFAIDSAAPRNNQVRYVCGQLILDYIWTCLRPNKPREECSTIYDYESWGDSYKSIVRYFKDESRISPGTMKDVEKFFESEINTN
jgi:hypothetical protein